MYPERPNIYIVLRYRFKQEKRGKMENLNKIQVKLDSETINNDKISQIIINYLNNNKIENSDIVRMENELKNYEDSKNIFSEEEIKWFINHHEFWRSLIRAKQGRRIFMHLYKTNNNVYNIHTKLGIRRATIHDWCKKLLKKNLTIIKTNFVKGKIVKSYNFLKGNEVLYCLNNKFPTLLFFTNLIIIREKINEP